MPSKGSNKGKCKSYKDFRTREKNKRRKLEKHLKYNPIDEDANKALTILNK